MTATATTTATSAMDAAAASGFSGPAPNCLRGWPMPLALCALVGALIAVASNRTASYADRLVDLRVRQTLGPDFYDKAGALRALWAVLLDAAAGWELAFKMQLVLDQVRSASARRAGGVRRPGAAADASAPIRRADRARDLLLHGSRRGPP